MESLHATEFASPRYFEKLRQLRESNDNAQAGVSSTAPIVVPVNSSRRQGRHARDGSEEKQRRAFALETTLPRTQRKSTLTGSIASLRSKVTTLHKGHLAVVEHAEFLVEEPERKTCVSVYLLIDVHADKPPDTPWATSC